ncbi:MAG: class I SAM-dependent methyltransferase [Solirubrobacterales bacterium]
MASSEWKTAERVEHYLGLADDVPHRAEAEGVLLGLIPREADRVLDLGTGDGRLLRLVSTDRPAMRGIALDFSRPMLALARANFVGDEEIEVVEHDLREPLPDLGTFDAVVSSFAIHHLEHERKRALYAEIFDHLEPNAPFVNLEHVSSPTRRLHLAFFDEIGEAIEDEDPSDRTIDVESQLTWLKEAGFDDVDCLWKWREMAVLAAIKPS